MVYCNICAEMCIKAPIHELSVECYVVFHEKWALMKSYVNATFATFATIAWMYLDRFLV